MAKFNWDDHPEVEQTPIPQGASESNEPGILDRLGTRLQNANTTAADFITSAGRGAVKAALPLTGITTEKLAGGVGALGSAVLPESMGGESDILPKDLSPEELEKFKTKLGVSYDQAKEFAERYKKEQEERSPIASTAGELGGSFVGGGALLKAAGKVAPALENLGSGQIVGKALGVAPEGGGVLNAAGRVASKAVESAPLGAVYGADAAPEGQGLEGAASGTALGAGLGGAIGAAGEGISGIKNLYNASKTIGQGNQTTRQLQLARKVGREGVPVNQELTGGESDTESGAPKFITSIYGQGAKDINLAADQTAKNATEQLYGAREGLQDQYGKVLTDLDKQGVTLTPKSDDLVSITQTQGVINDTPSLFGQDAKQTNDLLTKFKTGTLSPSEAKQLQINLRSDLSNLKSKPGLGIQESKVESTLDSINEGLNQLPDPKAGGPSYQDVNDLYREFSGTMGSLVNKGEIDPSYADKWISDLKNRSDIKDVMSQLIDYVQKPGVSGDAKNVLLDQVSQHFDNLAEKNPEFFKSQGLDFNKIKNNINQMSDLVNVSRSARMGDEGGGSLLNQAMGVARSVGPGAAYTVGRAEKVIPQFTQKLFNAPNEMLRSITPDLPDHISSALTNAINTNDSAKKNAVLFSIVQNPDLRKRVNKTLGLGEEP